MRSVSLLFAGAFLFVCIGAANVAEAADVSMTTKQTFTRASNRYCQNLWRCGPAGCNWYHVCTRPCPDGFSCAPLYGAYGPYGGVHYWGAYTDSGWSYYR